VTGLPKIVDPLYDRAEAAASGVIQAIEMQR
jgi:hypothetical protein